MFQLDSKMALITGGSRGLGRAIALAYADAGADVAIASRTRETCDEVVELIRAKGRRALAVEVDVSDSASVAKMVDAACQSLGRIDILVNSAGVGWSENLVDMSDATFDWILKTNLYGVFYCCRETLKKMIVQKSGNIINIASVAGIKGPPGLGAYSASKGGVIAMTKAFALENTRYHVRVNAIAPGYIRTDMNSAALDDPEVGPKIIGRIPMKRAGHPEEIGGLAIYLASEASSFVTGEVYGLSGGELAL